ncbi:MAG: hydroxyacid dehydrogenase [Butyrivibrio sp.]|jgi:uncharacterized protein YgbK (DUF1537 family)|nr:hydroxyacid dehydrogenase [Butyrivibrio sp.]
MGHLEHLSYAETKQKYDALRKYDKSHNSLELKKLIAENRDKIIVLDDDPTGIQSVHDVAVYTDWTEESLEKGFRRAEKVFYVLTNSRAMTADETVSVHRTIAENITLAAKATGRSFMVISRGDSTLRGHFPAETQALRARLKECGAADMDGEILIPLFCAGGRYTIGNIHYVRYADELIPAGETEFAADETFGYKNSDLCRYIEEKTNGTVKHHQVTVITLEEIRNNELDRIEEKLLAIHDFGKVVVNALDEEDLKVFCIAMYRAMRKGKHFQPRTAADFVKVFCGIEDRPLLSGNEMYGNGRNKKHHGGIVVIGSHTEKTTMQLNELKERKDLEFICFNSDLVLTNGLEDEVRKVRTFSEKIIKEGKTAVIYTKRRLLKVDHDTKEAALRRSVRISDAVCRLVGELEVDPAFIVAKGGITSSDIGVKALGVHEAYVMGQIQPGVPVWRTDDTSRFPGIPYVIFPGNVGDKDTLRKVMEVLV